MKRTMRNFLRSLPKAMLRRITKAWFSSFLREEAIKRKGSSGTWISGIWGEVLFPKKKKTRIWEKETKHINKALKKSNYFLIKVWALDQRNKPPRARIETWHKRLNKWYSTSSNRTQMAVATPRTAADSFLSLHKNTSAATQIHWESRNIILIQ